MDYSQTRNIFCIGRNYAAHAKELGNAIPEEPVVFLKPVSSLCLSGGTILLPSQSKRVDHEVEIVVVIKKGGRNISVNTALDHVAGYAVGIDVTARDLQEKAKKASLPWTLAKGFDTFSVIGPFVDATLVPNPSELALELKVNGELRQKGIANQMLFSIPELISWLSRHFTLSSGDLIYTGTPPGVGPLNDGDQVAASLSVAGATLNVSVASRQDS